MCYTLRRKCIKYDLGWGSVVNPMGKLKVLPRSSKLNFGDYF